MRKPLKVLNAKEVERLALSYAPGMNEKTMQNIVSVVLSLAKIHGIMIVRADAQEYQSHLRFLTEINWTP